MGLGRVESSRVESSRVESSRVDVVSHHHFVPCLAAGHEEDVSNVHEYFDYGIVTCPAPGIDVHIGDTMVVTRRSHHSEHSSNERTMERSHLSNLHIRSTKDTAELDKFVRTAWDWYIQDLAAARKNDKTRYLYVPVKRNSGAGGEDDNNQVGCTGKGVGVCVVCCINALARSPQEREFHT